MISCSCARTVINDAEKHGTCLSTTGESELDIQAPLFCGNQNRRIRAPGAHIFPDFVCKFRSLVQLIHIFCPRKLLWANCVKFLFRHELGGWIARVCARTSSCIDLYMKKLTVPHLNHFFIYVGGTKMIIIVNARIIKLAADNSANMSLKEYKNLSICTKIAMFPLVIHSLIGGRGRIATPVAIVTASSEGNTLETSLHMICSRCGKIS